MREQKKRSGGRNWQKQKISSGEIAKQKEQFGRCCENKRIGRDWENKNSSGEIARTKKNRLGEIARRKTNSWREIGITKKEQLMRDCEQEESSSGEIERKKKFGRY